MTDHARLRALCDAADKGTDVQWFALQEACDPATIRSLLNAADERDRLAEQLESERFLWRSVSPDDPTGVRNAARIRAVEKERDALRAAAEQARVDLNEAADGWPRPNKYDETLAALDAVLKEK